jgi:hypothetical protein
MPYRNMPAHEYIEFRTLDNTVLRGCLFPADRRGPGIIMTPGVRTTKFPRLPQ